jgi:hypothetical protein
MRTDLVTAMLMHQWLEEHMPEKAANWHLDVDDQIKKMVEMIKNTISGIKPATAAQNLVAKASIEKWDLRDVVVFGGGTPTPLSPKPNQVRYWTDTNPTVVAEATEAGYNAIQVDIMNAEHLRQLHGATSAVASGLIHFVPDAAVPRLLNGLVDTEIRVFVFNHGNPSVSAQYATSVEKEYQKLGINMFMRTQEQVQSLLPKPWRIEEVLSVPELLPILAEMNGHLDGVPGYIDVYRLVRS